MSKELRRGIVAALAVAAVAAFMGGCGLFQGQQKDDPFSEPDKTSSTRPVDETSPASQPYVTQSYVSQPHESQTPAETYVEPARPWGAETRDNIGTP